MPACNEQFAASGGATRPTLCVEQLLSTLVQSFATPQPASQAAERCTQAGDSVFPSRQFENE